MNKEIDGKRKVYHYLHNMASGSEDAVREGNFLIFLLPNPNWERKTESFEEYNLQIDPRDRRTLVVFDGRIKFWAPGRMARDFCFKLILR